MGHYTAPKASFASHGNNQQAQPKSRFAIGDRVRFRSGRYRGCEGYILRELTGYYEVHVFDTGVGVKAQALYSVIERA
jgi:hypothetical protein